MSAFQLSVAVDPLDPVGSAGSLAPELWDAYWSYAQTVYAKSTLPLREFEAARMRIAHINGCVLCLAVRFARDAEEPLPEAFYVATAEDRGQGPYFTERERLAAEFADRFATDHLSFDADPAIWERLHAAFTEAELVDLGLSVGMFLAGGRFAHVFGADRACPVPA
jgi:alkylhydroperoxidase family enzyme